MKVAIEYIEWIAEERAKINRAELEDIEFFKEGMKLDISQKKINEFKFCGLNNIDFILSEYYKHL